MSITKEKALKFLKEADFKAKLFSKDNKRKVGAIILEKDSLIQLSCGYNGLPRKLKETKKRWSKKNKDLYVIHAETNAIIQASRTNSNINNSIMVCNRFPCHNCCLNIIQAGIKLLITVEPEWNSLSKKWKKSFYASKEMLDELKIDIIFFKESELI
ncbi:MAG: CMP deaminase [Legionellales bacterium]|nr:CMP deaminase [Legionellales bacterium]|tara:strand:- start:485 stop:955 length:471 start_codon:yes stop_codon:yes gene_type:complete